MLWFFCSVALAHPFQSPQVGHQLDILLSEDEVAAVYTIEIPVLWLMRDLQDHHPDKLVITEDIQVEFNEQLGDQVVEKLTLWVDGSSVDWHEWDMEMLDVGSDPGHVGYRVQLVTSLENTARTINVVNSNWTELPGIFHTTLSVSRSISVNNCSLFGLDHGRLVSNRSGQWHRDKVNRELRIAFEIVDGLWQEVYDVVLTLGGESRQHRPAVQSSPFFTESLTAQVRARRIDPAFVALWLMFVLGAGGFTGRFLKSWWRVCTWLGLSAVVCLIKLSGLALVSFMIAMAGTFVGSALPPDLWRTRS